MSYTVIVYYKDGTNHAYDDLNTYDQAMDYVDGIFDEEYDDIKFVEITKCVNHINPERWKKESDDEFFGKRIRCNRFSKNLEGTVITQCKFFIEETDGNYLGGAI